MVAGFVGSADDPADLGVSEVPVVGGAVVVVTSSTEPVSDVVTGDDDVSAGRARSSAEDVEPVVSGGGARVARGLVNYDSTELPAMVGRSTRELARELGSGYEREVIHRDDLVLLRD